jgi:small subunit ribosomal protein S2
MASIDKMMKTNTFKNLSKRERLHVTRERAKLEKQLGSIADLNRLPSALFVVDILKEHIAVSEAKKLNIPTFAIVDTNSNPNAVDFPIPCNDDASKAIDLVVKVMVQAIEEGLTERKYDRDKRIEEEREIEEEIATRSQIIEEIEADEEIEDGKLTRREFELEPKKMKDISEEEGKRVPGRRPRKIISKGSKKPSK